MSMPSSRCINVYASLPLSVEPGDLYLNTANWPWVHCLTLPLETLDACHLPRRPYRWIQFAIGVVIGAQGVLSAGPNSSLDLDFVGPLTESADLYYNISDVEKQRMFPVHPDLVRTHVTSSVPSARERQFYDEVAERDVRRCVIADFFMDLYCDAVHLVPHSKGDDYISILTRHRSRDLTGNDIIHEINDIRNGLFLNKFTHTAVGKQVAFLMTPNFAMDTDDIDPTLPPKEKRVSAHKFVPSDRSALGDPYLDSGAPLRISRTDWPPAVLFDAVYGATILHNFGTKGLRDAIINTWQNSYYPGGMVTTDEQAATSKGTLDQVQEHEGHSEAYPGSDVLDMLLTLPYVLVPNCCE